MDTVMAEAELVAFGVGQDVPGDLVLSDVDGFGAEREEPCQFAVLVAVGGVAVEVQAVL